MRFKDLRMAIAIAAVLAAPVANAETWKTIHVGGKSDFTLDIPAAVDPRGPDKNDKSTLAGYTAGVDNDNIDCALRRNKYSRQMKRAQFIATIASGRRNVLCSSENTDITNYHQLDSASTTSNGYPASTCAASFTMTGAKGTFGHIVATLDVAAPDAYYDVFCYISSDNQDDAETHWAMYWQDDVAHIQASLHLPRKAGPGH